ncbi:MAG: restriction endonuclease subunit S [Methyloversatilis sp.]|nr:restriction endonuclease subunit S [Methyloversatilis sp.]
MSALLEAEEPSAKNLHDLNFKLVEHFDLLTTAPGGVAKLRDLILTLAMRGKLVKQEPGDEPASELLKNIRAAKERQTAEGKIKRDKPISYIAEGEKTVPLPTTWEWVRFGEILDFQGGGQPPKSNFSDVPLPDYVQLIQIRDLGDRPQPVYIPRKLAAKFCTPKDVMVGRYGASVGKVFWGKEGAYNVALVKMVDEYHAFDISFLYQLLVSPVGQSLFAGISRSAQDGFNKNDIERKLIPLPPLAAQSRIVTRIEELMRLCDAL